MTAVPLAMLSPGCSAEVKELVGGERALLRLKELGLVRGTAVGVLQNLPGGPLILSLGGTRLAVGRGLAMKVLVHQTNTGRVPGIAVSS